MTALTYLHIGGTLDENMVYRARPGFESSRPGARTEGDPAYQLTLLDREGRPLVSVAPQVAARGCGLATDPHRWRVRGALPLHPNGASYELRRGNILLSAVAVPAEPPRIASVRHVEEKEGILLEWKADDGARLTFSIVLAMESGRRITVARNVTATTHRLDLTQIPEQGRSTVFVIANDGVRSTEVEAATISAPARPPTVHILVPETNARLPFGQPLSVIGTCLDMAGRPCPPGPAVWSMDGERFAAGSFVAALHQLSAGTHRLALAYGEGNERVESSMKVEVDEPHADYHFWRTLMTETHRPDQ